MAEFYVEQQGWAHWPKVLIMCRKNGRDVTRRRYVQEVETGDGMSITDELRKVAAKTECANGRCEKLYRGDLESIADRIDVEHEEAIQQALMGEGSVPATDENMAEHGWVRLPKDANGEYIHIGDEMEGVDKYDSLKKVKGKVITVNFESDGTVEVAIKAWSSDGKSWHRAYLDPNASVYRHHHAPTVEDLLREMLDAWGELPSNATNEAIVAEYAKRLTLAEVVDE